MNDKKYQVFVSSTFTDLQEERRKVLDVLLMADCIPAGMEAFVATDDEQFEVIKKVIDLCDYYILIIGQRYGSINALTDKSYTEMEYEYAKEIGVPVLVFAIDDSVNLPPEKTERDEAKKKKLEIFKNIAMQNRLASIWKSSDDLTGKVAISIMKAKSEIVRPGWQRGNDFDEASLRREIMDIQKKLVEAQKTLTIAENEIALLTADSGVAFDDCVFEFCYKYYVGNAQYRNGIKSINLPDLFEIIAIAMEGVALTEIAVKTALKEQLLREGSYLTDGQIVTRVLIQLQALNLIHSHTGTGSDGKFRLYWSLTPKGKKARNAMILIKKERLSDEE